MTMSGPAKLVMSSGDRFVSRSQFPARHKVPVMYAVTWQDQRPLQSEQLTWMCSGPVTDRRLPPNRTTSPHHGEITRSTSAPRGPGSMTTSRLLLICHMVGRYRFLQEHSASTPSASHSGRLLHRKACQIRCGEARNRL